MMELPPPMGPMENMIWIGGHIDRSTASLLFSHDDLDPDIVTRLLGCQPTRSMRKGDLLPSKRYQRIARTGLWSIKTPWEAGGSLEAQISGLLDQVTDDFSVWEQLSEISKGNIFCGIGIKAWNRGFSLSPALLKCLGDRHLALDFDIYCHSSEEDHPSEG